MVGLPGCISLVDWEQADCSNIEDLLKRLPRPRKRITELMWKKFQNPTANFHPDQDKTWELKFCRTPKALLSSQQSAHPRVEAIDLIKNRLEGDDMEASKPVLTGLTETVACGLVVYSIGYKSVPIEGLPWDEGSSLVKTGGNGSSVEGMPGVYACGWCARGARGVLAGTQLEAKACSKIILEDVEQGKIPVSKKGGGDEMESLLRKNCVRWLSWEDWLMIDQLEQDLGAKQQKPREKITDVEQLLSYCRK